MLFARALYRRLQPRSQRQGEAAAPPEPGEPVAVDDEGLSRLRRELADELERRTAREHRAEP